MPGASPPLHPVAQGVFAWLQLPGTTGRANAGVVIDEDGVTVVDTLMVRSQWEPFAAAVEELGHRVRRVVLTSGQVEFVGGTSKFPLAAVFGSPLTSFQLDQPVNLDAYRRFMPDFAAEFDELPTRPVSHIVDGRVQLTPAVEIIPTKGHTGGNLMVRVPAAGVLFAGGMCSFGVTPLAFQGDPAAWAKALDEVSRLADIIVPGHGPVGGAEQVRHLQGYLRACVAARGDPGRVRPGPWDNWADRHLDAINVERAALLAEGDDSVPMAMRRAIGMA